MTQRCPTMTTTPLPADEDKKQPPQQDEQLHKAIQVLKSKTS